MIITCAHKFYSSYHSIKTREVKMIDGLDVYYIAVLLWRTILYIFFREIKPRGTYKIPTEAPVIFVAAPHHNQVSK